VSTQQLVSLTSTVCPPGKLASSQSFPFSFPKLPKHMETYYGNHCFLRFFVRGVVIQRWRSNLALEQEVCIHNSQPKQGQVVNCKVGFMQAINAEIEVKQDSIALGEAFRGKVLINKLGVQLKKFTVELQRREVLKLGSCWNEVWDSIKEASIPEEKLLTGKLDFELPAKSCKATPSYEDINGQVAVEYYLSFVFSDSTNKSYYKKVPVSLFRKDL